MKDVVQRFKLGVVALLIFSLLLPSGLLVQPNPARAAELINLALGKTVKASTSSNAASNGPEKAVDGNTGTSWNSNSKDLSPWLQVDFGGVQTFNEVKLNWRPNNVKEMKVQYLSDSSVWTDVYVVRNAFPNSTVTDTIDFDPVSSSSIRIQLHFDSKNFQLYELQVYNNPNAVPPAEKLSSIILTDAGNHVYNENEVVSLAAGGTKSFLLKGKLDNGNDAVLSSATNFFKSSDPSIASVDKNGNVTAIKDGKTTLTADAIIGGVLKGITIPLEVYDPVAQSNIALNKSATASSGNAAFAVDGTNTAWVPSTADADDKQSSLTVNLGETYSYNRSTIRFTDSDKLNGYTIQASEDGTVWKDVYTKTGTITTNESVIFSKTSANYVRLQLHHLSAGSAVAEFELYGGLLDILNNINFFDATKTYQLNDTIYLNKGNTKTLQLKGNLTRNLEENDLSKATVSFESKNTKVATIDANGKITAVEEGVVLIVGKASLNEKTVYISIWVDVTNPNKDLSPLIADLQLSHSDMKMEIGQPALVNIGAAYPAVTVNPYVNASVGAELVRNGNEIIQSIAPNAVQTGGKHTIEFDGNVAQYGDYQIRLTIVTGSKTVYDTFYFTVLDPQAIPTDQSSIVYMGPDNKLLYIPDFKGNRVLDFSNVGYNGGGVKLPDAPVKATVEPIQGDATQLIQEAIDQVSAMPEADGIRGAVLLKKGRYEVSGTLKIQTGGVVLRGEGQDEAGGTVIYGSGTKARSLIEVGNSTGLQIDTSTATEITDMFVPSGARTFRVADASKYNVGDTVIVRRVGNQSWIHETEMDKIYDRPDRPDAVPGSTSQMTPFNLDFDRVIDKIEGNVITVDAPIANSIELRWGGGQLMKYSDPSRIQNVGVEYMYVDSAFDPSIIDTVMDNDTTDPYLADENHVEEFVVMNGLKNGWVRNITAKHLAYSLVKIDRNAKWVTVQDSKITDFVSIVTGGRRYAYYFVGQLNLVQRSYSESERHAFVFDSRIPGPNVIHDSESQKNYNSSEPHHRWSTGGLFDKVKGHIVIRDRAWLGSGHAWAGANYVTWNTEGILTSQQPPTAQNYAIGHVGTKGTPLVPNEYDPRPRNDAYWDHLGTHVKPDSLYLQQLQDRLGQEAVDNIKPPLTAPTGLTATAGDAQVSLKWSSVTGATYYNVKRSTTPGTGYATVAANVANTQYADIGLENGTTYYYIVTAGNTAGESDASTEASAQPKASIVIQLPAAPTGLSATAGDAQVSLKWNSVTGATYYNVKRSTTPGTGYVTVAANVANTQYADIGLENGTTYYYVVTAGNTAGESDASTEASAQPKASIVIQVPAAPSNLTATAGDAQVSLKWSSVTGATYYNVKRSTTPGTGYVTVAANVANTQYADIGLENGTTYYYVVTAGNTAGESDASTEASAQPKASIVIQVPAAPSNLTATAGDAQVSLKWSSVTGATYYNVKRSTTPGTGYVTVAANVANTQYADIGLENGTTYYYVVTAGNTAGESDASTETSAQPKASIVIQVPAAPSNLTATAGDAQVSLKWNSVTGATYYNVKRTTTPGTGYVTVAANVANNSYTDSGLQYGSTYYYVVTAANSAYESADSNEASVTLSRSGRGNGGGGGSSAGGGGTPVQPSEAGSQVLRVEPVIGKAADGRELATIEVDASALSKALEAIAAGGSGATMQKLTIEAGSTDAATAIFRLPAQQLADIAAAGSGLVISFQYGHITYELPVKAVNFAELAKSLGAPWNDVKLVVTLENLSDAALSAMKDKANQAGLTLHPGAGAIDFKVSLESKGKTVTVEDFGLNYVSRKMNIGKPKDLSKTTAVTYDPAAGQFRFVPALFTEGNEGTQVTIKRPGNSIYTVVESSKTFADLTKHWSQSDVELLASKLVVNGMTESSFAPDNRITRAEFAAILVRGLGLNEASAAKFTDVLPSDWYAGVVGAAAKAGLVDGFEDGTFKPNANITREQMAVMAARAMTIVGKKAAADAQGLASFSDSASISSWAKEAAAQTVTAGIMNGMTASTFVPGENATRAEAAVMVKRLLQYAQLMN
ncbi:S-layer homology domain-containing protein [Paenibacillus sp. H1-7]|uniref:S-layer homology domain-containing protein n=1 Tax=Paenibacillus sp. H1-7 TaxID=2282849 RepID=UPI001EF82549|nr:S-layer homology domain-containing protein [Paenibacillus sp. H1-7]